MKTKTYILIIRVYTSFMFPVGTIIKITDDYWGKDNLNNDENTGFTVVSGKLKGKKGCVADGLDIHLIENNKVNRLLIKNYLRKREELQLKLEKLEKSLLKLKTPIL